MAENAGTYDPNDDTLLSLVDSPVAHQLIQTHVSQLISLSKDSETTPAPSQHKDALPSELLSIALAALEAFLQANVTGPVLPTTSSVKVQDLFFNSWTEGRQDSHEKATVFHHLRRACLRYLQVDGVSPYAYIPHIELFSLARYIIIEALSTETADVVEITSKKNINSKHSLAWTRLRINVWHYKIITQPSLGSNSNFNRSAQWSDIPTLATTILDSINSLRLKIVGSEVWATSEDETWTAEEKALFLVEAASNYILLGNHEKAKEVLKEAVETTKFQYALSGALGKRTRFQENSISQLVVFAKSYDNEQSAETVKDQDKDQDEKDEAKPEALQLNNDTLLEEIAFNKDHSEDTAKAVILPPALAELSPDNQPQLSSLDEIILLTDATIKDAFSPIDALTSEQILPFAVRVLTDKSVNWQIYTQALLVRSRIEVHRSRTVERGVLQLQAVADQVLTDTTYAAPEKGHEAQDEVDTAETPAIQVTAPGQEIAPVGDSKPTSFLPAPKPSESAPAHVRLRYIHAISTPPRWHLESELAYAWAGIGSMASALEIFKRLRLWAEVALCLASAAAVEDEDGRGSGGNEKAKGIIRWRLFSRTGTDSSPSTEPEDDVVGQDVTQLKAADFSGPERTPPPPEAPRLWCILGDLENDPSHYERAWDISKHRFARAQRSLGEYCIGQKDWEGALQAFKKATRANRLSPETWGRLGDISLRLGQFQEAADAYSRSISSATDAEGGEGARTWSNLGSALWSLYLEKTAEAKKAPSAKPQEDGTKSDEGDDEESDLALPENLVSEDPSKLLAQSLAAYKKGASISHDNWRIWDNVVTLASKIQPVPVSDIVQALANIIRIRKTEDAIDADLLSALLQDAVLSKPKASSPATAEDVSEVYEPPRGSPERLVTRLIEDDVVPLITHRSELWTLVSRLRTWRRDYPNAIEASERAWRAAAGSSGSGLLTGGTPGGASVDWTSDRDAWTVVVRRTDELVSALENWGPRVPAIGPKWKGKARSAIRSVMGRGRENWEDSDGWTVLEGLMEGLRA